MKIRFILFFLLGVFCNGDLISQQVSSANQPEWMSAHGYKYRVHEEKNYVDSEATDFKLYAISAYSPEGRLMVYKRCFDPGRFEYEIYEYQPDGKRKRISLYDEKGKLKNVTRYEYDSTKRTNRIITEYPNGGRSIKEYKYDSLHRMAEVTFRSSYPEGDYRSVNYYVTPTIRQWKFYNAKDSLVSDVFEETDSSEHVKKIWTTENGMRYLSSIRFYDTAGNLLEQCLGFSQTVTEDFRETMNWQKYEYNAEGANTRVLKYLRGKLASESVYSYYKELPAELSNQMDGLFPLK